MKFFTLLFFLWPVQVVFAEVWQNQYLADTGGSRMIVVELDEREMTEAFVDSADGIRLRVSCFQRPPSREFPNGEMQSQLGFGKIGNGGPFLNEPPFTSKHRPLISVTFDNTNETEIGEFSYAGGSYYYHLPPSLVAQMSTYQKMSIADLRGEFTATFNLTNAAKAIAQTECQRL